MNMVDTMTWEEAVHYTSFWLPLAGSGLVFYWMAMAWQRYKDVAFCLLGLSSSIYLLVGLMDFTANRQKFGDDDYFTYAYLRVGLVILDGILFPLGMWRLILFLKRSIPAEKQPTGSNDHTGVAVS